MLVGLVPIFLAITVTFHPPSTGLLEEEIISKSLLDSTLTMLEAQSAKATETAIATETSTTVAIKGLKARTWRHLAVGEEKRHYGRVTIFGYSLPLAV
jgi:hypothetical protein